MPFSHHIEDEILVISVSGRYDYHEEAEIANIAPTIVKENNLNKVIFDFNDSDTKATSKIGGIHNSTSQLSQIYPIGTDFAIVNSSIEQVEEEKLKDFFENVAFNRGVNVKVYSDRKTAKQWLFKQ